MFHRPTAAVSVTALSLLLGFSLAACGGGQPTSQSGRNSPSTVSDSQGSGISLSYKCTFSQSIDGQGDAGGNVTMTDISSQAATVQNISVGYFTAKGTQDGNASTTTSLDHVIAPGQSWTWQSYDTSPYPQSDTSCALLTWDSGP